MLVREASQRDYLSIQRLMTKAGVSITGEEQDKPQFLVVENEQQMLIGMVGVEKTGSTGMLRSLILDSAHWNAKLSLEFLQVALAYAQKIGLESIYMCAKSGSSLFDELGFSEVEPKDVSPLVQQLPNFKKLLGEGVLVWCCELVGGQ